jgi:subtilisin family serine protease
MKTAKPQFHSRLAILVITSLLGVLILSACSPNPTAPPTATPVTNTSAGKVDPVLLGILLRYSTTQGTNQEKTDAAVAYARQIGVVNEQDNVVFELELDAIGTLAAVTDKIKSMGGQVVASEDIAGTPKVRVTVPLNTFVSYINTTTQENFLRDLADFKGVTGINIIYGVTTKEFKGVPQSREEFFQTRQTRNQGVRVMGVDRWQAAGFTGKGVKVGIIDGGFKFHEELLGTALPRNFTVQDIGVSIGEPAADADVHGTAVAEIIHSIAPDAELIPAAINGSDIEFNRAIDFLVSRRVDIISISMGGNASAGDGNSPLSRKIEQVRTQTGILFFIAAGNEGDEHYVGTFSPQSNGYHEWVPGVIHMAVGNPSRAPFQTTVILNWEQWKDGGINPEATDLDLEIRTKPDLNAPVVISSSGTQRSRPPREVFNLKIPAGTIYYINVRQKPNTPAPRTPFRLHIFTAGLTPQFFTPQMAVGSPSDSRGAFSVGAVDPPGGTNAAIYSSQGPLTNGVFKPDISGPSGVGSASYALEGGSKFPGTSASTPQVSGLAALLKSANPSLSPDELTQVLFENVKDNGAKGPDYVFGYGEANISGTNPGQIRPRGNAPAKPAPNPNPEIKLTTSKLYPAPVTSPDGNRPVGTPPPTSDGREGTEEEFSNTYEDNFQDPASGLPNSGSTVYQSGRYQITATNGQLNWGVYPTEVSISRFYAEITVAGITDGNGIYGFIFWYTDERNYHMLMANGSGLVQVGQYQNGAWREVIGWTQASGWKTATAGNKLQMMADGTDIRVAVNAVEISRSGKGSGAGTLGLAAGSYSGTQVARFDNLLVGVKQ